MSHDQRDISTERIERPARDSVQVRVGGHRWTIPLATIGASMLAACGVGYRVVAAERESVLAQLSSNTVEIDKLKHQGDIVAVKLAEIQASNARVETQLAELRSELLRRSRP